MPSKNDLSGLSLERKNKLPENLAVQPGKQTSSPWPKPKLASEKESKVVTLKITMGEMDALKEKAGLVPIATYVKHYLREESDLLE